ncbi:mannosyl-oligosaccharide 1,2-alpha-mannosidase IA [Octopus bimaculoides]|uniref:mannosyl-oligosaccharide 1,2-alpha-mannosidase IA n=1 Tax=Octopus bimaculoides TaxID=37653 RepID=UPI0022E6B072|nr:mannosyl-oligosaccharide 1,2-alpha-mannosidase IA [Octopus bimaculoides]
MSNDHIEPVLALSSGIQHMTQHMVQNAKSLLSILSCSKKTPFSCKETVNIPVLLEEQMTFSFHFGATSNDGSHLRRQLTAFQSADLSVFETNIRFLGGFLSAYALTGDKMFKEKAIDVGNKLLPAFDTPTGIPQSMINLKTGGSHNWGWASGGCSILAEFGSIHLEFIYLSNITGNKIYEQKVMKIRETLQQLKRPQGLYPIYLNPRTGKWGQHLFSVGAMGDSFYEYLLKTWLYTGKKDTVARQMYDEAVMPEGMICYFSFCRVNSLYVYAFVYVCLYPDINCFDFLISGGMFALGAEGSSDPKKYIALGEEIARTCHESYNRSSTRLGPEAFRFEGHTEAKAMRQNEKYYILRPEVIETYFYMWRFTKNKKYREWGWDAVQLDNLAMKVDL